MLRVALLFGVSTLLIATVARSDDRGYGGAVVTREHGVRVIRPRPPVDQLIVEPAYGYRSGRPHAQSSSQESGGINYGAPMRRFLHHRRRSNGVDDRRDPME